MKSAKPWGLVGLIVWEGITFIDLAVDLYTGKMTVVELIQILMFCLTLAVIFYVVMKRRK